MSIPAEQQELQRALDWVKEKKPWLKHRGLRLRDDVLVFEVECRSCTTYQNLYLTREALTRWAGGELIQRIWPGVPIGERELMLSGRCGECFDHLWEDES